MGDLIGKRLGSYRITEKLGSGGMATVFKAYQPRMDRFVALKLLPRHLSENPEFASRFKQEAQIIAKLEHPYILPVHDYGESEGYAYLVMRLVEGHSLAQLMKQKGALDLMPIARYTHQISEALDYAHKKGVIHRDVKPGNVLIDDIGNCLLTDFGIAKLVESTTNLTATGGILGTPTYVSPEQGMGEKIDQRSDIYSLGVVLYQMVVGDVPYKADTPMAVIYKHIHGHLPLPRHHIPDLPESIERVILKALAKDPDDRYATTIELANSLNHAVEKLSEPLSPAEEDSEEKTVLRPQNMDSSSTSKAKHGSKNWRIWIVAMCGLLLLSGLVFWAIATFTKPPTHTTTSLPAKTEPSVATLYVKTEPSDAAVRVLNTDRAFYQGLTLEAGQYHMEISAEGYEKRTVLVSLANGENKSISVRLKKEVSVKPEKRKTNHLGMEFVYIKPGTFMMGSPLKETGRDADEVQHLVTLTKGFYLQTTEVTQGQWKAEMDINPSYFKNCGDDCPVEKVSWNNVQEFIRRLNKKEGENIYRLPTEAEWEYACRSGSLSAIANSGITETQCGNDPNLGALGWYCGNSKVTYKGCYNSSKDSGANCAGTHPVAQKQPNAWGLFDMHGNVWEWCQDWRGDYPPGSITDPIGASEGTSRIVRGGSWGNEAIYCRSANRFGNAPDKGGNDLGFRLVMRP